MTKATSQRTHLETELESTMGGGRGGIFKGSSQKAKPKYLEALIERC